MYWFIVLFPLLIYPWGPDPYYTQAKVVYLYIFVLGYWLYIIVKGKYQLLNFNKDNYKLGLIVTVLLMLVIISTVFSVDIRTSLYGSPKRYEGLLTLFCYFSVLLFSYRLLDMSKIVPIFHGMLCISVVVSIYGIFQHYMIDFLPRRSTKLYEVRSYAFFDNPNFFGSYLVIIILISLSLYLINNQKKHSIYYFIAICLSYIALIFSGTRSGWLGIFFGVLFFSIFVVRKKRELWKKFFVLLLTWCILFLFIDISEGGSFSSRINAMFFDSYKITLGKSTGEEGSFRFYIWRTTIRLLKDHYLLGSGPDTFEYIFPQNSEEKIKFFGDQIVDKAHNEYLQMAVTMGIPALIVYLYLLYVVLNTAFKAAKNVNGNDQIILYGLIATILGYLVQAFFNISVVPVAPIFWFVLGITMAFSTNHLNQTVDQIQYYPKASRS